MTWARIRGNSGMGTIKIPLFGLPSLMKTPWEETTAVCSLFVDDIPDDGRPGAKRPSVDAFSCEFNS